MKAGLSLPLLLIALSPVVLLAQPPGLESTLTAMQVAADKIDTFRCTFTTTYQYVGPGLKPGEERKPEVKQVPVLVCGDKFLKARSGSTPAGEPFTTLTAWNGSCEIEYSALSREAFTTAKKPNGSGQISDPRRFVYAEDYGVNRITEIRRMPRDRVSLRMQTFGGRSVILIEALYGLGYRIWVEPSTGLPVQVETCLGEDVAYRFKDIRYTEIKPGVWFPIQGTYENIRFREEPRGQVVAVTKMVVDPKSIELSPPIDANSFTIPLPPGTNVFSYDKQQGYTVVGATSIPSCE